MVLFTGCIGLLITSILWVHYRKNHFVNIYLILVLAYVSIYCLLRSTYALGIQELVDQNVLGFKRISIFNFPLLHLFFKKVLGVLPKRGNNGIHFVFPTLFFGSLYLLDYWDSLNSLTVSIYYLIYFCTSLTYLVLTIKLIATQLPHLSFRRWPWRLSGPKEKWMAFMLLVWCVLTLRIGVLTLTDFMDSSEASYESGFWICTVLTVALFIRILVSPELLYGEDHLQSRLEKDGQRPEGFVWGIWNLEMALDFNNQQDELLAEKVNEHLPESIQKIEQVVMESKLFRNPQSDLTMLAGKTNLPKSHLTYIFKYHCELYFPDFKKMAQINDAEQLIEAGYLQGNTLESLSTKVGFASYNPFFTAFKKHTGMSPQNYVGQNRAQWSSYKLS